jgi:hypothetical protein
LLDDHATVSAFEGGIVMKRLYAIWFAVLVLLAAATPVFAGVPARNCPTERSGWFKVDAQGWWDETVDGMAIAGIDVYVAGDPAKGYTSAFEQFAIDQGFVDAQALYEWAVGEQWLILDRNGDGYVCMRTLPINPANPGFFFGSIDNSAR